MKTTLNHLGKLTLCLLCAVAMIVPSINMAAATPANKAKTTKVKKSKKRGKGKKRSTKKTELTIIPTQEVVEVPINVDVQIDDRYGTTDITRDVKVEECPPLPPPAPSEPCREEPKPEPKPEKEKVFTSAAKMPEFPGGPSALIHYISMNLRYPQNAQDNGIEGKVVVQFIVEKDGSVGEVKIARGVDKDLDREAVRVCKSLPKFSPGRNASGDPIRVWYTLPVTFKYTKPTTIEGSSN